MGSFNQVQLIGTLGKDPEVKSFQNGGMVANFTLATNEPKRVLRDGTEIPEQTEWHNIVCNGSNAKIAQQCLRKGLQVHLIGKLRTRSYEKDNVKHYVTEVMVQQITLLGSRPQEQTVQPHNSTPPQQQVAQDPRVQQFIQAMGATAVDENGNKLPF